MAEFNINTASNETKKFVESRVFSSKVGVAVVNPDGSNIGNGIWTLPYDAVTATYPTDTTEVYSSRQDGLAGSVQEVVTVTYTDSAKTNISSVVRV